MVQDKLVLQEEDLELVVGTKKLGSLTTNAKEIKELVEKALPNYDISNYNEDNIDSAKKDKAMLNKASKLLNSKRIEIEKEFMKPFAEFKEIVGETVALISTCSSKIDTVVQKSIEQYKKEKIDVIKSYFDSKEFELVSFERIFNEKWLNKTAKIKDIQSDIDSEIEKINDDLKTLEAIGENVDLLKSLYLDTLNINSTIQYANTLKQNSERAKAEAERAKAEESKAEETESQQDFPADNSVDPEDLEPVSSVEFYQPEVVPSNDPDEILVRTMRVTAPKSKIIALADFMNANGIEFEKI